MVETWNL